MLRNARLDLSAEEYFALFRVGVPPFEAYHSSSPYLNNNAGVGAQGDEALYPDPLAHGAASFFRYVRDLELHFRQRYA